MNDCTESSAKSDPGAWEQAAVASLALSSVAVLLPLIIYVLLRAGGGEAGVVSFLSTVSGTSIGGEMVRSAFGQMQRFAWLGVGPYPNLVAVSEEIRFAYVARMLVAQVVGAVTVCGGSVSMAFLFLAQRRNRRLKQSGLTLALAILFGLSARLILAGIVYGNYDMASYDIVADIGGRGSNVYAETFRYNYSPVWSWMLNGMRTVADVAGAPSAFPFLVRFFLSVVDLLTLALVVLMGRAAGRQGFLCGAMFIANPVSTLITGYHGQFENLAILLTTAGIWAGMRHATSVAGRVWPWLGSAIGLLVKHNTFYFAIGCVNSAFRGRAVRALMIGAAVMVFALLLLPYWEEGKDGILRNVLLYGSIPGSYGLTSLVRIPGMKTAFVAGLCVFPLLLRGLPVATQCLLSSLFFVSFTTGAGLQYFVMPIAFGSLHASSAFVAYTAAAAAVVAGSDQNCYVPGLQGLSWNLIWAAALFWFGSSVLVLRDHLHPLRSLKETFSGSTPQAS